MNTILSDGTINWIGGMDTSRDAANIAEIQYSKACNVIIPDSLGGVAVRFGLHCTHLSFDTPKNKIIYENNPVLAEGYYVFNGLYYLIALVNGYVFRFTKIGSKSYYVENLNPESQNSDTTSKGCVATIPGGCLVCNGTDRWIHVTPSLVKRLDPDKKELTIGRMGAYLQNRFFYVDQSGKQILASDFLQPTKFTLEDTNIFGFMCPDSDEEVIALSRQKSIVGTVEGGNLIWSSNKDIYSSDVRGTRSEWANLSSRIGKVSETVPGFAACSQYSFESFNTNIYFRDSRYGVADIKSSEYQFVNLDSFSEQSTEASYFYRNDTSWMLSSCYTRSCNKRLYTTVAPEKDDNGNVYWNGLCVFSPSIIYSNQESIPRRHESVFTGVRPWCVTVVKTGSSRDEMFIHSYDVDGINRLYVMDEDSNYDIDRFGNIVEIKGHIETRAYTMQNPLLLKDSSSRFYRLNSTERDLKIKLFARPETQGQWTLTWDFNHIVPRFQLQDGHFSPVDSKPQTRPFVNFSADKFDCYRLGNKFTAIQYRLEFEGPMNLHSIVVNGSVVPNEKTISTNECGSAILEYQLRKDYYYNISK